MKFPDKDEFLQLFGIQPIEEDPSVALCRYRLHSKSNNLELDLSFSAIQESFQVLLYLGEQQVVNFVSERTTQIELYRDSRESGLRVHFDVAGAAAEAIVTLEPEIKCRWWLIRTE